MLCRELTEYLERLEWTEDQEILGLRALQYVSAVYYLGPVFA